MKGRAPEDWVWRVGSGEGWLQLPGDENSFASLLLMLFRERGYVGLRVWDIYPRLHDFSQESRPARLVSSSLKPNSELYVANVFKFICSDSG